MDLGVKAATLVVRNIDPACKQYVSSTHVTISNDLLAINSSNCQNYDQ